MSANPAAKRAGLQVGELTGVQSRDVDFEGGFIEVRRTLHDGDRAEMPKNGKMRRVEMSRQLAAELIRFHDLRHTFAARLLQNGESRAT